MQLKSKKELAAKVLEVGKDRIYFVHESLNEIKEAITRRDIIDLHKAGSILVKEKKGRKQIVVRKHRRGRGKVRKKAIDMKRVYVLSTRKLRKNAKYLLKSKKIDSEKYRELRRMIRASKFKGKKHMLEHLQ